MEKRKPRLLDMSSMRDIVAPYIAEIRENMFFSNEIAMIYGSPNIFRLALMHAKPPFVINDHRMAMVVRGEVNVNINLQDRHITAGTLLYVGPGAIINPIRFSDDLEIYGMALFPDFPMPFASGQMPAAFNGQVRDFMLSASDSDLKTAMEIFSTLWQLVRQKDYHRPTASALVAAMMHHYDQLFRQQQNQQASMRSREQSIFDRFIALVNEHCTEHHQIAYYAERMCLTERYLNTVIRQTSDATAKEWIDRAIITRVKIELRHTDKPVAQISDEMCFPNPSFFSKYFRRLVGITPLEYRQ